MTDGVIHLAPGSEAAAARSTTLNPRLAPQDIKAEVAFLGGVLLAPDAIWDVVELLAPEDFYRDPHRLIFAAMLALAQGGRGIELVTLCDELRGRGDLEAVGGVAYVSALASAVPTFARLQDHAGIIRGKAISRRLVEAAHEIARDGYEQRGSVDELVEAAEQRIFAVADRRVRSGLVPAATVMAQCFKRLEHRFENPGEVTGLATGLHDLDALTTGLQAGQLVVVAGRPSMGKTAFALGIADCVATGDGARTVAFFSLEQPAMELQERELAQRARVDLQRIRSGRLLDADFPKLARAADRIAHGRLHLDETTGISALEIRAKARRLKARHPDLALVIVDYLQLMRCPDAENREQEVAAATRALKALAKELAVPVVVLAQLNRLLERRTDKRPCLSDLRESGAIEQDADLVVFLYRDEVYNGESKDKGVAEVIVGKQRNGPTGTVRCAFLGPFTLFENLAHTAAPSPRRPAPREDPELLMDDRTIRGGV